MLKRHGSAAKELPKSVIKRTMEVSAQTARKVAGIVVISFEKLGPWNKQSGRYGSRDEMEMKLQDTALNQENPPCTRPALIRLDEKIDGVALEKLMCELAICLFNSKALHFRVKRKLLLKRIQKDHLRQRKKPRQINNKLPTRSGLRQLYLVALFNEQLSPPQKLSDTS